MHCTVLTNHQHETGKNPARHTSSSSSPYQYQYQWILISTNWITNYWSLLIVWNTHQVLFWLLQLLEYVDFVINIFYWVCYRSLFLLLSSLLLSLVLNKERTPSSSDMRIITLALMDTTMRKYMTKEKKNFALFCFALMDLIRICCRRS